MSSDQTGHIVSETVFLGLFTVIGTSLVALCTLAMYQTMQAHKKLHFSKILIVSQLIFYISAISFALSRIFTSITYLFAPAHLDLPWNLMQVSYVIHWFALLFILMSNR